MRIQILDHGYIELIDSWGSDEAIIEAARMSTAKGFLGWDPGPCPDCDGTGKANVCVLCGGDWDNGRMSCMGCTRGRSGPDCKTCAGKGQLAGDKKLLRFLWEKKHSTPFEFGGLTIEVQAPLMVFREWHRHRTQSYSERSARYTPLPDNNYVPSTDRMLSGVVNAQGNRQATGIDGSAILTLDSALEWQAELADTYEHCERTYQSGLKRGVPKELARLCVPVGRYSTMRATANLRNWLGFEALRLPKNAQYEIRVYAEALHDILMSKFPRTTELFDDGMSKAA